MQRLKLICMGNVLLKQSQDAIIHRPVDKPILHKVFGFARNMAKDIFVCISTRKNTTQSSRIKIQLTPGSVVTTSKKYVGQYRD